MSVWKVTEEQTQEILAGAERREELRAELKTLTNDALADRLDLDPRTVQRVIARSKK